MGRINNRSVATALFRGAPWKAAVPDGPDISKHVWVNCALTATLTSAPAAKRRHRHPEWLSAAVIKLPELGGLLDVLQIIALEHGVVEHIRPSWRLRFYLRVDHVQVLGAVDEVVLDRALLDVVEIMLAGRLVEKPINVLISTYSFSAGC